MDKKVEHKKDMVLVRYGEISLKGKNRPAFEKKLIKNMLYSVRDLGRPRVYTLQGRMMLDLKEMNTEAVLERLCRVFGVVSLSPVSCIKASEEDIYEIARESMEQAMEKKGFSGRGQDNPVHFRVTARRADKSFPLDSMELSREIGAHLLKNIPGLKVDLHNPELVVSVEIRRGYAYIFSETWQGPGGLPVGVSGKASLLLSGGIDSPVAGWMLMKRGVRVEAVHFHSFPFTGEKSKEKVLDLCRALARYCGKIDLHVVHFTEIQKEIQKKCPEELRVTIMRRFMFRIAERLADKNNASALVSGESVGQVASQTLESIYTISEVNYMPVLRPLVGFDKVQITDLARQIGTYDISIQPYEDCCTLFLPKHPSTKPRLDKAREAEEELDIEGLIDEALERTELISFPE